MQGGGGGAMSETDHAYPIDRREAIRRVTALLGGVALVGGSSLVAACERAQRGVGAAGAGAQGGGWVRRGGGGGGGPSARRTSPCSTRWRRRSCPKPRPRGRRPPTS